MGTTPKLSDFILYKGKPINDADYRANWALLTSILTSGGYDLTASALQSTSLAVSNDATINGNISIGGTITANKFSGDGSELSGISAQGKNFFINGNGAVVNYPTATLVKDTYHTVGTVWQGMATGTAVSAGTVGIATDLLIGNSSRGVRFNDVTLTGAGVIYLRYRFGSEDAVNFKNEIVSFSFLTVS